MRHKTGYTFVPFRAIVYYIRHSLTGSAKRQDAMGGRETRLDNPRGINALFCMLNISSREKGASDRISLTLLLNRIDPLNEGS